MGWIYIRRNFTVSWLPYYRYCRRDRDT